MLRILALLLIPIMDLEANNPSLPTIQEPSSCNRMCTAGNWGTKNIAQIGLDALENFIYSNKKKHGLLEELSGNEPEIDPYLNYVATKALNEPTIKTFASCLACKTDVLNFRKATGKRLLELKKDPIIGVLLDKIYTALYKLAQGEHLEITKVKPKKSSSAITTINTPPAKSMGSNAAKCLKECTEAIAFDAFKSIRFHLNDESFENLDDIETAKALAKAFPEIQKLKDCFTCEKNKNPLHTSFKGADEKYLSKDSSRTKNLTDTQRKKIRRVIQDLKSLS